VNQSCQYKLPENPIKIHIFVIYHKRMISLTNFQNSPKNPLISQRPKKEVGNPAVD
jgi:hypothetical protein